MEGSMRRSAAPFLFALFAATSVTAQVVSVPTAPPIVTADNESWYLNGEPIQFQGDDYYPAGADVFFNANQMVRSGDFLGIPLYVDTTLEPYSVVYVPLSRGEMKPYERRRTGGLASTTGSRAPSFPVSLEGTITGPIQAQGPPTSFPAPPAALPGEVNVSTSVALPTATAGTTVPQAAGTGGVIPVIPRPTAVASIPAPRSNDGVWIPYLGGKWFSAGAAVPLTPDFRVVGTYSGFPVFAHRDSSAQVIYLPSLDGMVAPYRLR
jgi:hypothetical protein